MQVMGLVGLRCTEKVTVGLEFDRSEGASHVVASENTVPSKATASTKGSG